MYFCFILLFCVNYNYRKKKNFSQQIKAPEVKKLLKERDIKKPVVVDTIPPKLIKIGADIIAEPLMLA